MPPAAFPAIADDLYRYTARRGAIPFLRAFAKIPGFRYSVFMRICSVLRCRRSFGSRAAHLLCKAVLRHYAFKFGYQVPEEAEVGPGLRLSHFGPTIVNSDARIGSDVNLHPGVIIGEVNRGPRKGFPVIGDRVWIGANAVIVGAVTIGNDVLIAPGSYVTFDVPDRAVVSGNPAVIVSFNGVGRYIENTTLRPGRDLEPAPGGASEAVNAGSSAVHGPNPETWHARQGAHNVSVNHTPLHRRAGHRS